MGGLRHAPGGLLIRGMAHRQAQGKGTVGQQMEGRFKHRNGCPFRVKGGCIRCPGMAGGQGEKGGIFHVGKGNALAVGKGGIGKRRIPSGGNNAALFTKAHHAPQGAGNFRGGLQGDLPEVHRQGSVAEQGAFALHTHGAAMVLGNAGAAKHKALRQGVCPGIAYQQVFLGLFRGKGMQNALFPGDGGKALDLLSPVDGCAFRSPHIKEENSKSCHGHKKQQGSKLSYSVELFHKQNLLILFFI